MHGGTSKAYILERLKREKQTALSAAVNSGTISALTAAVSLGWVKRAKSREQRRNIALRAINGEASLGQLQELWLGPDARYGSLFGSREELAHAWKTHGDEVIALFGSHGRRPQGWWAFAAPFPYPGFAVEKSTLYTKGLLPPEEMRELEKEWRAEFERTYQPEFFVGLAFGRVYHGEEARRMHFEWADIPASLVAKWTEERQATGTGIAI